MSRLTMFTHDRAQTVMEGLYKDVERRIIASPPGLCPIDMSLAFLHLCHSQSCGKCIPCRVGLGQLQNLIKSVLDGEATLDTIDLIETTARGIKNTADCAIGFQAAEMVLQGVIGFRDDYEEHVLHNRCISQLNQPVPCVALCPAHVDIPGYIALVNAKREADAVRLIRKDNPFPAVCGFICEHPCENRCRRNIIDDSLNIRGLKRYAVEKAGEVEAPVCMPETGNKIAIIGAGPCGLSAAYFLQLMGHKTVVFEKRTKIGGMLRYGIPSYRLPRKWLDYDTDAILSTGVELKLGVDIGNDITLDELRKDFDSVFISVGAHTDKKLGIPGEGSRGVMSAVEMLRNMGNENFPDFEGKRVVVIGGGNVAMDVCRTSIRLGAKSVKVAYRRRLDDMTALREEVEGAIAEGCDMMTMMAPIRVEYDDDDNATALVVQPQIVGEKDKSGRPRPRPSQAEEMKVPCDIVIVSIGQGIEYLHLEECGVPVERGTISALNTSSVINVDGVFAAGDCVTGPATVIKAIAGGKVAAANIDEYLGYNHEISTDIEVPAPVLHDRKPYGRVNMFEKSADERKNNFDSFEICMSDEEASQESSKCLRCDYFGYGIFKGGRNRSW